jgi:hypothetical protein
MINKCKIGKDLKGSGCQEFGVVPGIYLGGLIKRYVIPVGIVCAPAEIRTGHL